MALLALRLLKTGQVFITFLFNHIDNDMCFADKITSTALPHPRDSFQEIYELDVEDESRLVELVDKLYRVDFKSEQAYRLACNRFGRYFLDNFYEDKLIDLCIGFEALFLEGRTTPNLGLVIGVACSMLLGKSKKEIKLLSIFQKHII